MKITDGLGLLQSVYIDWSEFIANPNFIRKDNSITWAKFQPKIIPYPILYSDVVSLIEEGQYTFQLTCDGSILQLHYLFNKKGDQIISANLAFYSTVILKTSKNSKKLYDDGTVSWLRIDYDPESKRGVLHPACHMHLSSFPDTRFGLAGLPNPKQFVEFIMVSFYPEAYEAHRGLDKNGQYPSKEKIISLNNPFISVEGNEMLRYLTHFCVPDHKL